MEDFATWLNEVKAALASWNMHIDDWQKVWHFDFESEHGAGVEPNNAAMKANRFWWRQQNKARHEDCQRMPNCWLPRNHSGECQPV